MQFKIQSLLYKSADPVSGNDKITGAMAPVMAANELSKNLDQPYTHLARVWFEDHEINQQYEGPELTGMDTLIGAAKYPNTNVLFMFVDKGTGACPVALYTSDDRDVIVTPIYQKHDFARSLTKEELQEIFDYCNENFETAFEIKEKRLRYEKQL